MPPAFHRLADANLAAVPIIALAGLLIATLTGQLSVPCWPCWVFWERPARWASASPRRP